MNLFTAVSIGFILMYLVVAIYVSLNHRTTDDFYVMGRSASPMLITGTLIATAYSSVTLIGYTGLAYSVGPLPYVSLFGGAMIFGLFVGLHFGRRLWRLRLYTLPDFFSSRYPDSPAIRSLATAIVLISMVLYLITIMIGTSIAMEQLLGWSTTTATIVVLAVAASFTFVGGMRGVVITDTIMFVVFFLASLALAPFIIAKAGGWPTVFERASAEIPQFDVWKGTMSTLDGGSFLLETFILALVLWVASPQLISRAYIARDEKSLARAGVYLSLLLPLFVFGVVMVFGALPLIAPGDLEPANAFPWVTKNLVPPVLGAFALAGIVASSISTASSLLQQGSAALSRDIYQRFLKPGISDAQLLTASRISVLIVAAVVFAGASISGISARAVVYGFLLASAAWAAWAPALVAGVMWKRATNAGAVWSMSIGLVVAMAVGFGREAGITPQWLAPNTVGLVVAGILMVVVSLMTQPSKEGLATFAKMAKPDTTTKTTEETAV